MVTGESDSVELPLQRAGGALGERAHIAIRREDGAVAEFELEPAGPAADRLHRDGRPHLGAEAGAPRRCACRWAITRSPRGWAPPSGAARYIVTPERAWTDPHLGRGGRAAGIAISLYGVRSGAQLGLRRFSRPAGPGGLGGRRSGRQLRRPEPAARHPQPPPVQHQPLPAELHLLPELHLPGYRRHGGFRAQPAGAGAAATRRRWPPKSRRCARAAFVEYERVAALKLRFLKLLFVRVSAGVAAGLGARPRVPRPSSRAKAICSSASPPTARWTSICTGAIPNVWVWTAMARARTGTRHPPRRAQFRPATLARA